MIPVRQLVSVVLVSAGLVVSLAGCHKRVPVVAVAPPPPPPAAPTPPPPPPPPPPPVVRQTPPPPLTEEQIFARKSLAQLNDERPLADVHFDLDDSTILDDQRAFLQRDADWMRRWSSTQVTIEGHCDSRGSSEYNLALGSRRADAIKQYLQSLGIEAGRLTVTSKGKESPICTEEIESCWQQNRRGHFVITAK
jgi:peptidoglycan-associated lipoprotein